MSQFRPEMFTATSFHSQGDKAKFANHFVRFLIAGCPESLFHHWFYKSLSSCFSHIAHYDRNGFYDVWFSTPQKRSEFVQRTLRRELYGDPEFTFVDVEKAIQEWLALTDIPSRYSREAASAAEVAERALLRKLLAKYSDEVG